MSPADPLAMIMAAVLDPAAARPAGRLRPLVTGWPVGVLRRVRRSGQNCKYRPGSQPTAKTLAKTADRWHHPPISDGNQ
jgi:hypothetical protein